MSSDEAINVTHLCKRYPIYDKPRDRLKQMVLGWRRPHYRAFWALNQISLQVKRGETIGIVGCNGSGKSTLLQIIGGISAPTSGEIEVNGRIASLLELGSGFHADFTGRENVYINGAILGLTPSEIDAHYDAILDFAGIGTFIDQPVKKYSSGMLLRLAFAVSVHVEPDILLVDEALAVGDELFQQKCFARFRALRARGTTILFVSHSGQQIVELCDRALLLDAGECLGIGRPQDILGFYRKMMFAPPDQRATIREAIPAHIDTVSRIQQDVSEPVTTAASRDAFDPALKPLALVDYISRGARIEAVHLFNEQGEKVNCLQRGQRYHCVFHVSFQQPLTAVRFGISIHSKTGLHFAGSLSSPAMSHAVSSVVGGQTAQVAFAFDCRFNPGIYFVHTSVHGNPSSSDETLLHRIEDACAFRVQACPDNRETGIVYLAFEPTVTWQTPPGHSFK